MLRRLALQLSLAALVLCLFGVGFWLVEPTTPRLVDGLWLAFATASTIGYGDVVPTTAGSRLLAVPVLLLGFAVLSMVTAAIAAMWVESQERRIEREILRDMHAQMRLLRDDIAALRGEREPVRVGELGLPTQSCRSMAAEADVDVRSSDPVHRFPQASKRMSGTRSDDRLRREVRDAGIAQWFEQK